MIISFFEEFPTKENLDKLNLVTFPTKLYIAAKNYSEFERIKISIKNKFVKEFVYWPILEIKEGYWISPFSRRSALKRILEELNENSQVMLDLELPTTKNPTLYLTQGLNFFRNKMLIQKFIKNHKSKVYLAEYYPSSKTQERILSFFGLHYNYKNVRIIKMVYHSLHKFNEKNTTEKLRLGVKEFGNDYLVSFGTIARGINRDEPILSLKQLNEDLKIAKKTKVEEVVIFRLGGLNKNYAKLLKKFV